jgi:succinate dehydrogenase/fumarate reductase iron-sulfur protein
LADRDGNGQVRVTVARSDPGARSSFLVDRFAPMTVLDLLLAIQRGTDASIGFRYSCRVAMCGTCTVRVDGRTVLACQEPVPAGDELELDPVAGLPVVRDLIVDTSPFWAEWASITPYLVPVEGLEEPARIAPTAPERRMIDPSLDCIGCAACWSSCSIAAAGRDFLGPAALNRAMVLIADSRDAAGEQRMSDVGGADGLDRCHYVYGCSAACPKGLDPAGSIRRLRRWRLEGRR